MISEEKIRLVQQTLLSLGDEFLSQYFLCAHKEFRGSQILSRLFAMGHSLELYLKAALVNKEGVPPHGHDISSFIEKYDRRLGLSEEELEAGKTLFSPTLKNFDIGLYEKHRDALELYQAIYFVTDLKYYLTKDQKIIFPVRYSLKPLNMRYLEVVRQIRNSIEFKDIEIDKQLVDLIAHLGFEFNPAKLVALPHFEKR